MLKYLKDISSGFFILVVAFSYSIYFVIATFLGIPQEGVVFRLYSGILAVVVAFVFFLSIHRIPRRIYIGGLLLCAIIILLYFPPDVSMMKLTTDTLPIFYQWESDLYLPY